MWGKEHGKKERKPEVQDRDRNLWVVDMTAVCSTESGTNAITQNDDKEWQQSD
jgi:hypothetical protein